MPTAHGPAEIVLHIGKSGPLAAGKQVGHILQQLPLVFLHRQNVIGFLAHNLPSQLFLVRRRRINGHDATGHIQQIEQFRYGRDLIGFLRHFDLTQYP